MWLLAFIFNGFIVVNILFLVVNNFGFFGGFWRDFFTKFSYVF